jgi:hypothetical protein
VSVTLVLLLVLACITGSGDDSAAAGDGGGGADDGGVPSDVELRGECALSERVGGFTVESNDSYALVEGVVRDGVVPADVLDEVSGEGDCTMWRRTNPFCDPSCASGETCNEDGECIEYPLGVDLGVVTVDGLLGTVEMTAVEPDKSYFNTSLPNPPWTAGAGVVLRAGAGADAIELWGVGLTDFTPVETAWVLTAGTALALTWDTPTSEVGSKVRLDLNVDQHGATPISLTCLFDDDGAAELPASQVDALLSAGISGFPNGKLSRQTADRVDLSTGCVDFKLRAPRTPAVSVSGHTPCTEDEDCPKGQTCDEALETCV